MLFCEKFHVLLLLLVCEVVASLHGEIVDVASVEGSSNWHCGSAIGFDVFARFNGINGLAMMRIVTQGGTRIRLGFELEAGCPIVRPGRTLG